MQKRGSAMQKRGPSLKNVMEGMESTFDDDDMDGFAKASELHARRSSADKKGLRACMRQFGRRRSSSKSSSISDESVDQMDFGCDDNFRQDSIRSIDTMDFGYGPNSRKCSIRSILSNESNDSKCSNLADSQGLFLSWKNKSSTANDGKLSNDSEHSNLVDSDGFLGWDSQKSFDNSQDVSSNIVGEQAATAEDDANDDNKKESGSGTLSLRLRRLSDQLTGSITHKKQAVHGPRHKSLPEEYLPKEETNDALRCSAFSYFNEPSPKGQKAKERSGGALRQSLPLTFFRFGSRGSDTPDVSECEIDDRPAIWIKSRRCSETGAVLPDEDIRDLRRSVVR